jgi:hypothetical protein
MTTETLDRIESIIDFSDLLTLKESLDNIAGHMLDDGFEKMDVKKYIRFYLDSILEEY